VAEEAVFEEEDSLLVVELDGLENELLAVVFSEDAVVVVGVPEFVERPDPPPMKTAALKREMIRMIMTKPIIAILPIPALQSLGTICPCLR
jgi:hypothetical protein